MEIKTKGAETRKKGRAPWVFRSIGFNLDEQHSNMIEELLADIKKTDARKAQTDVITRAIEESYATHISKK